MNPDFRVLPDKKLIGKRTRMALSGNTTMELWKSFMPRRKEIKNSVGTDLFSVQVYDPSYNFKIFDPDAVFDKWAAIEVSDFAVIPSDMETLTITGGLYAVFLHTGPASTGPKTFQYIFGTWLPNSEYLLDYRPHFELLGARYKNEEPDSEEEVWIPVKPKSFAKQN